MNNNWGMAQTGQIGGLFGRDLFINATCTIGVIKLHYELRRF